MLNVYRPVNTSVSIGNCFSGSTTSLLSLLTLYSKPCLTRSILFVTDLFVALWCLAECPFYVTMSYLDHVITHKKRDWRFVIKEGWSISCVATEAVHTVWCHNEGSHDNMQRESPSDAKISIGIARQAGNMGTLNLCSDPPHFKMFILYYRL